MRTFAALLSVFLTGMLASCTLVIFEGVVDSKDYAIECVEVGDCESTFYLYVSNEFGRDRWEVQESVYDSCEVGDLIERSRTDRIECTEIG